VINSISPSSDSRLHNVQNTSKRASANQLNLHSCRALR